MNGERGADLSAAVCCLVSQLWGCWGVRGGDKLVGGSVCGCNASRGGSREWQNNPRASISITLLAHIPCPHAQGASPLGAHSSPGALWEQLCASLVGRANCATEGSGGLSWWLCPLSRCWVILLVLAGSTLLSSGACFGGALKAFVATRSVVPAGWGRSL